MAQTLKCTALAESAVDDPLAIHSIDYVEFWVGNAYQAAHFYRSLFGFDIVAMAGPETGVRDRTSYVLRQGTITLVVTAPLGTEGPIAEHVALHGDGVRNIALRVGDVDRAYAEAVRRGGTSVSAPETLESPKGRVRRATIATYGDTVHSFVARDRFHGSFLPGYRRVEGAHGDATGLRAIDHVVGNVELGHMAEWVAYYRDVLGFTQLAHFSDDQISTKYTALMSKVMQDRSSREVPHQRAGAGQGEEPDPGVPGLLSRARRAAHRSAHQPHCGDRAVAARAGGAFREGSARVLRRAAAPHWDH